MIGRRLLTCFAIGFVVACDTDEVLGPATLTGEVRNRTGQLIQGAIVSYSKRSTTTDKDGKFVLTGLPYGYLELHVSRDGYDDLKQTVQLSGTVSTTSFEMTPKSSGAYIDSIRLYPATSPVRLTGPGTIRIRTSVFFGVPYPFGAGQVDTTKIGLSTTGPVTASWELGNVGWRALVVTTTGVGTGTVTATYKDKTASIAIESVDPRFKRVTSSAGIGCALTDQDLAWCWGGNMSGALGTPTLGKCSGSACQYGGNDGNPTPLPVNSDVKFTQIATTGYTCTTNGFNTGICGRTCALTGAGETWCWGDGIYPVKRVAVGLTLKSLSLHSSQTASCGLTTEGKAYCFTETVNTPIAADMTFKSFASGPMHSCGVDLSGDAYCWGSNRYANLGIGSADTAAHPSPTKVQTSAKFTAIAVGRTSSCGLDVAGTVICWGFGGSQFQNNDCTTSSTDCVLLARPVTGGGTYVAFAHSDYGPELCALTSAGAVDCWTNPTNPPTQPFPVEMVAISVGTSASFRSWCGISMTGIVYCGRPSQAATKLY